MVYGDEECFTRLNFKRNVSLKLITNKTKSALDLRSQRKLSFSKGLTVGGT